MRNIRHNGGISGGFAAVGKSDGAQMGLMNNMANDNVGNSMGMLSTSTTSGLWTTALGNTYPINIGSIIGSTINGIGTSLINNSFSSTTGKWQGINSWDLGQAAFAGLNSATSSIESQLSTDKVKTLTSDWGTAPKLLLNNLLQPLIQGGAGKVQSLMFNNVNFVKMGPGVF